MTKANRALIFHLLSIPLVAALLLGLSRTLPVAEWTRALQKSAATMPTLAPVLWPLLFAFCNILMLPGGLIAVGSGLLFGFWVGGALNILGATLAAAIALAISRKFARRFIERRLLTQKKWTTLDAAIAREGWKIIFLTQVHPLFPTSLLNYLYGTTQIPAARCLVWTALGQAPGMFLYAYLGSIARRSLANPAENHAVLWFVGPLAAIIILALIAKLAFRILEEAHAVE